MAARPRWGGHGPVRPGPVPELDREDDHAGHQERKRGGRHLHRQRRLRHERQQRQRPGLAAARLAVEAPAQQRQGAP